VRLENLSFRKIAIAISVLAFLNWVGLQFVFLPKMTQQERTQIYAGWMSTPFPYAISLALICIAIWFAISYRGRYSTRGRRIAAFGMAIGALGGMLLILVIRATRHI